MNVSIATALKAWQGQIQRTEKLFTALTDEQVMHTIAPGKNSAFYILGHLVAVNDGIVTLLGVGNRLVPEWDEIFIKNPDNAGLKRPTVAELREKWKAVHANLDAIFSQLTEADWLSKHTLVSAEDFAKDNTRNRLGVVIGRATHVAYHMGQLVLLSK